MAALGEFSPLVEQASVDEAYVDGQGLERLFGSLEELVLRMTLHEMSISAIQQALSAGDLSAHDSLTFQTTSRLIANAGDAQPMMIIILVGF